MKIWGILTRSAPICHRAKQIAADKNRMGRFGWIVCGWAVVGGMAFAETVASPVPTACWHEIAELHGVRSPQAYFPLYIDEDTVAYLAVLGAKAGGTRRPLVAVLPVYAAEPVHFRRGNFVFLSTGLIVEARNEQELIDAIQIELQGKRTKRPAWRSACAAVTPIVTTSFPETQRRLAVGVAEYAAEYAKWATPHLKRREEPGQITSNR